MRAELYLTTIGETIFFPWEKPEKKTRSRYESDLYEYKIPYGQSHSNNKKVLQLCRFCGHSKYLVEINFPHFNVLDIGGHL